MQRYDENYRNLILKINDAFTQNQNTVSARLEAFEKVEAEKKKFIENMPYEEIRKIGAKIRTSVTDVSYVTEEEEELIKEIRAGRKRSYKQVIFQMTGEVHRQQILKNYQQLIQNEPVFRTLYLYDGLEKPVRVVVEQSENSFSVHDIRGIDEKKRSFFMKNVLAAEARREYNIETDPVLYIHGYQTDFNKMLVVVSIYPHVSYPMGIRGVLYRIFEGMKTQSSDMPVVDEETIRKMNRELREKSIAYWKNILLPLGKSLTVPGERGQTGDAEKRIQRKVFLHKKLEEELVLKLNDFCQKNHTTARTVFLSAWGNLLGKYHDEKYPVVLVAQSGEKMDLFPVRFAREQTDEEKLRDIDDQLAKAPTYSSCTIGEVEAVTRISFPEYFRMVHSFVECTEINGTEGDDLSVKVIHGIGPEDTDINLFVGYKQYGNDISIHYFSKEGIIEIMLDNLHDMFLEELTMIVSQNAGGFDKRSFIRMSDSDEEKLYKLQLAQIGLYLKQSGIFESVTVDDIMKLAEYCSLTTYMSNDAVILEKSPVSSIYIVGDGTLQESLSAPDGMVKSIRVVEQGSVFGLKSLFQENEARSTYTAVSEQTKLVEIDREILKEVLRRKPEGWIALLEDEDDQKNKLQHLLTME